MIQQSQERGLGGRAAVPARDHSAAAEDALDMHRGEPTVAASAQQVAPEASLPVGPVRKGLPATLRSLFGHRQTALHHVERGVGILAVMGRLGPATRDPLLHRVLERAGVLQRRPSSWDENQYLRRLPWGGKPIAAPAPEPPGGIEAAWPQPPLIDPRFSPRIGWIESAERDDHGLATASRYVGQIVLGAPAAAWNALSRPRLAPLDDAQFDRLMTATCLAQFIARDASGPGYTMDFTGLPVEHTLPGVHAARTIVRLHRVGDVAFEVTGIRVNDYEIARGAGARWELARYFALQGAQYQLVMIVHPRLHFPLDPVNAITRALLPAGHVVHRLMAPHLRFTMGLHEAVIHHRRSPMYNNQREIYTPFPFDAEGSIEGVALGVRGREGSATYRPYRFDDFRIGTHTLYGRYLADWYAHFLSFTRQLVAPIERTDPLLARWADAIANWVPGFPDGSAIWQGDTLAEALATVCFSLSVWHSADHHNYSNIPLHWLPWRLRRAPPDANGPDRVDLAQLVSPEDYFRAQLAHAMFFRPVVRTRLADVDYRLHGGNARAAADAFKSGMAGLDARWHASGFARSTDIAASLQY